MKISTKVIAVLGTAVLAVLGFVIIGTSVDFSLPLLTGQVSRPRTVHQDCRDADLDTCPAVGDAGWYDVAFVENASECIERARTACDARLDPMFEYGTCGPNRDCTGYLPRTCTRDCMTRCIFTKKDCCGNSRVEPPEECDPGSMGNESATCNFPECTNVQSSSVQTSSVEME